MVFQKKVSLTVFTKGQCFRKIPKDSESFGIIRLILLFYMGFGTRNKILREKLPKMNGITGPTSYVNIL